MMLKLAAFLLITQVVASPISTCHAEVRFLHNSLTVNIDDESMKDVLDDLRQRGDLNIVTLEETKIGNVRISKKFWNLPLEAGLDRLLSDWNYGINRDTTTGKITTLYLVSRRIDSSDTPELQLALTNQPSSPGTYELPTNPIILHEDYDDTESPDSEDEEYDEFATASRFPSDDEF